MKKHIKKTLFQDATASVKLREEKKLTGVNER